MLIEFSLNGLHIYVAHTTIYWWRWGERFIKTTKATRREPRKKRIRTEKYGRMDLWTKIKISQFNSIVGRDGVSFRLHANESIFILDAVFDEY